MSTSTSSKIAFSTAFIGTIMMYRLVNHLKTEYNKSNAKDVKGYINFIKNFILNTL